MDVVIKYIGFIIPLVIIQFTLMIVALVHVLRHEKYRVGNRILWIIVVCCLQMIGPILYFVLGRSEEE